MITIDHPAFIVRSGNLQSVLYTNDMIKSMAAQLVAGQVEAHLDMISDAGPKEYGSFVEVDVCIRNAKETVKDYIEDLLSDFRETLYAEIAKVDVKTTAVLLKPNDEIDADVTVSIE